MIRSLARALAAPLLALSAVFLGGCATEEPLVDDPLQVETIDAKALLARAESSPSRAVLLNFWATW